MPHELNRRLSVLIALAIVCPTAPATAADSPADACRQMASDINVEPTMYAALCTDAAGLSQVCANQVKQLGPSSTQNYLIRHFIVPNAACKDKKSVQAFCSFAQSFEGYETLGRDESLVPDPSDPDYANLTKPRERALKLCATSPEAVRASLCGKADAARQWQFAYAQCPVEGKSIYVRECVKPTTTDGEGAGRVIQRTPAECAKAFDARPKTAR